MASPSDGALVRIALFIDGGYFDEVSRYYKFGHARGSRLSLEGVQEFVRQSVAEYEQVPPSRCAVVSSHYYRGRFSASEADAAGKLRDQAAFDDILIRTGVAQHYLPVMMTPGGARERGVEISLSLEAYELALTRGYEVCALVCCDGDYAHLARKLVAAGVRTMVLAWDFHYELGDPSGRQRHRETRTAQALIDACTYPVLMAPVVEESRGDPLIDRLFVQ